MAVPVKKLVGITADCAVALNRQGIRNSDQLLEASRTPKARKEVGKICGMQANKILDLADRADLVRIRGIGGVFSDLLEHVRGIKTVGDLAKQRPEKLHHELEMLIEERKIKPVGGAPSMELVTDWINQAKGLEKVL